MAYLLDPLEEEKQKNQAKGLSTSGVIGGNVGAASNSGPVVDTKAPTSSGFVNLQAYLDANKGAGQAMATKATEGLVSDVNKYVGDVASQTVSAHSDIKNAGSKVVDAAKSLGSKLINETKDDASGPDYVSQARDFLSTTTYGGPKAEDVLNPLKGQAEGLKTKLGSVSDVSAQEGLLRNAYGGTGNYSKGFGMLDSFLIRGSDGGRKVVDDVVKKGSDVQSAYDKASNLITDEVKGATAGIDTAKQLVKDSAKTLKNNIITRGQGKADTMPYNPGFVGAAKASLGDGLTGKNISDIEALDSIIGDTFDPNAYLKTWRAGEAPPPVQQVVTAEAPISVEDGKAAAVAEVKEKTKDGIKEVTKEVTKLPTLKSVVDPKPIAKVPTVPEIIDTTVKEAPKVTKPAPIINIPKMAKKAATPWWKKAANGASTIINGNSKKSTGTGITMTPGALQIPTEYTPTPDAVPVDPATVPENPKEVEDLLRGFFGNI